MPLKLGVYRRTRFLEFVVVDRPAGETILVRNQAHGDELGHIEYYSAWRQYCYVPAMEAEIILSHECMIDIGHVLVQLTRERKLRN